MAPWRRRTSTTVDGVVEKEEQEDGVAEKGARDDGVAEKEQASGVTDRSCQRGAFMHGRKGAVTYMRLRAVSGLFGCGKVVFSILTKASG